MKRSRVFPFPFPRYLNTLFVCIAATVFGTAPKSWSQPCVTPPQDLVSWWAAEGNADDQTAKNPGTLVNGLGFSGAEVGSGFYFDGSNEYFSAPASQTLNVGAGAGFTLECWIWPFDLSGSHAIAEWNDAAGHVGTHLYISIPQLGGLGSIYANIVDSNGNNHQFSSAANVLNVNGFQHIALSYDRSSGTAKIYLNGAVVANYPVGTITPQTSYGFYLGARPSGLSTGAYFHGIMDEASVYSRALADSEVLAIYDAGSGGKCQANPPIILSQPTSLQVHSGANANFNVVASGFTLNYQWQFNGNDIQGATNASLFLSNIKTNDAGTYTVTVSNIYGNVLSSAAVLTVNDSCVSTAPGIVSWWPAEGTANDALNGNNGTLQGGMSFGPGESGQGFSFDGTNGYITVPASPSLDVGASNGMTLECWIKPSDVLNQQAIAEWDNGTGAIGVHFWFSVNGLGGTGSLFLNVKDSGGSDHELASAQNIVTTNFQHVAFTYNRTNGVAKIYRNGIVVASQTMGSFRPQTTYPLNFGARVVAAGPGAFYQGLIDEPAVYNRALTDSEIQAVFLAADAAKTCIPPQILTQPSSFRGRPGTNVTFSVAARGTAPVGYEWTRNGVAIAGATNSTYSLTNVQPSSAGTYSVRITNALGTAISSNVTLKVDVVLAFANGFALTNSPAGFAGSATIQLLNLYTNGDVFYTLDGSSPSFFSTQYTGPLLVTQPVILRALGYSVDFFQFGELDPVSIYIQPPLSLSISNNGGGSVTLNPTGGFYLSNVVVTANATASPGWTFLQWLGDATGTTSQTTVTMTRNKTLIPVFGTTLSTTAAGGGTVILNPTASFYPYGSTVLVSAIPDSGNYFGIWGNAATGSSNPLTFQVTNANSTISSLFAPLGTGQVGLTVVPVGNGRVNVSPKASYYSAGQLVTITASPDPGQSFIGWSGNASGNQNPLPITMNQNRTIYANFGHNALISTRRSYEGVQANGFIFTVGGDYGGTYEIDTSTDLRSWTALTVVTNTFGSFQVVDPAISNFTRRFYRAVRLP